VRHDSPAQSSCFHRLRINLPSGVKGKSLGATLSALIRKTYLVIIDSGKRKFRIGNDRDQFCVCGGARCCSLATSLLPCRHLFFFSFSSFFFFFFTSAPFPSSFCWKLEFARRRCRAIAALILQKGANYAEKCGERRNGGPTTTIRFLFASATGFANVGIRICRAYQASLTLQRIRSRHCQRRVRARD